MNNTTKAIVGVVIGSIIISGIRTPSSDNDPAVKENRKWIEEHPNATDKEIMEHNEATFKKYERPKDIFDHINDAASKAFYMLTGDLI